MTEAFNALAPKERAEILRAIARRLSDTHSVDPTVFLQGWAERLDPQIPHEPYEGDPVARDRHGRLWERAKFAFGWHTVDGDKAVLTWALLWESHGPLTVYEVQR